MPVHSAALGQRAEAVADLDVRWVLAYAAALEFRSDLCLDDAAPGGPVVPPTFCVCLEWLLAGDPVRAAAIGLTPEERLRGVHALQDSAFFAPFRPGMHVRVSSEIRYMRSTRAGTLMMTLLESHDERSGDLLCRSWSGSMFRSVPCDAVEAGDAPPCLTDAPLVSTAPTRESRVSTERGLPHTYTECARIWNPIHTERAVALRAGLPDIILHGTATWALAGREVLQSHANGDVRRLRRLSGRFRAPVRAGGEIVVRHAAVSDGCVMVEAGTDTSETALTHGIVEFGEPHGFRKTDGGNE